MYGSGEIGGERHLYKLVASQAEGQDLGLKIRVKDQGSGLESGFRFRGKGELCWERLLAQKYPCSWFKDIFLALGSGGVGEGLQALACRLSQVRVWSRG